MDPSRTGGVVIRASAGLLTRTAGVFGTVLTLTAWTGQTAGTPADPFVFFQPTVHVEAGELRQLARGQTIARVLPGRERDVVIFSATPVGADSDRLMAWMRSIEQLKRSDHVLGVGRFSAPPRIEDLDGLSLDNADLDAIRRCRPGDCGLKLGAEEIAALQCAVAGLADWRPALQAAFRRVVLGRVTRYLAGGHALFPPFVDHSKPVSLDAASDALIRRSLCLTSHLPALGDYLAAYPRMPLPGVESFLYWSKEQFAGKATVSVTHVSMLRRDEDGLPALVVAGKQVFATHYMNASLSLTAITAAHNGEPRYLAYLNRSNLDVLGGLSGAIARVVVEHRVRQEAVGVLQALRVRLEGGDPPGK